MRRFLWGNAAIGLLLAVSGICPNSCLPFGMDYLCSPACLADVQVKWLVTDFETREG